VFTEEEIEQAKKHFEQDEQSLPFELPVTKDKLQGNLGKMIPWNIVKIRFFTEKEMKSFNLVHLCGFGRRFVHFSATTMKQLLKHMKKKERQQTSKK